MSPKISNLQLNEEMEDLLLEEGGSSIHEFLGPSKDFFTNKVANFALDNCHISPHIQNSPQKNFEQEAYKLEEEDSVDSFELQIENNKLKFLEETNDSSNKPKFPLFQFDDDTEEKEPHFLEELEEVSMLCFRDDISVDSSLQNPQKKTQDSQLLGKRQFLLFIEDEEQGQVETLRLKKCQIQTKQQETLISEQVMDKNCSEFQDKMIREELAHAKGIIQHVLDINSGLKDVNSGMAQMGQPKTQFNRFRSKSFSVPNSGKIFDFMKNN